VNTTAPQVTPAEAMQRLDAKTWEIGQIADALADIERKLEPVEVEYQAFVDNHEIGLYQRSIEEDGFRLPSESLRAKLANRAMDPELFGKRTALRNGRDRAQERIKTLRVEIDALRSILSALKEEAKR
jgi:hypothetical protein